MVKFEALHNGFIPYKIDNDHNCLSYLPFLKARLFLMLIFIHTIVEC